MKKNEHMNVKYHFIRSATEEEVVALVKSHSPTDIETKSFTSAKLTYCIELINVIGRSKKKDNDINQGVFLT